MSGCTDIQFIFEDDYIGDSLAKITSNFSALSAAACSINQQLDARKEVRTFFYYGPNGPNNVPTITEFDNQKSRPSNSTIENFVNNELALPSVSQNGDIAWVIYQRTGWQSVSQRIDKSGSGKVPYQRYETFAVQTWVGIGGIKRIRAIGRKKKKGAGGRLVTTYQTRLVTYWAPYSWSVSFADVNREYAPIFVLYKLVYNSSLNQYKMEPGFPKYTRATTNSTQNWNKPELWNTY